MFAVQNVIRKTSQLGKLVLNQRRTIVATPPRCKVPKAERLALGAFLWVGVMTVPLYIACHVRDYNGTRYQTDTD